jgi:signal transduction histidine kinase
MLLVRDARRAGRLVDDLLTLARLDAGLELAPREVDLTELARAEIDRMTVLDEGHRYRVEGAQVLVVADPEAVGRALTNLLANARRHSPAGGTVTVTVRATDGGAEIGVRDEGPGIAPGDRERIFDRMVRLDDARVTDAGSGAGLGLAIARGTARAHGGDLRCIEPTPMADDPTPDGSCGGAYFVLTLPHRPGARSGASTPPEVVAPGGPQE